MELSKAYLYGRDPEYDSLNMIFKEKFNREAWGSNPIVINISSDTGNVNIVQHNMVIDLTSNEDEVQSNIIVITSDYEDHNLPSDVGLAMFQHPSIIFDLLELRTLPIFIQKN
ncbi:hypothetical protein Salat_2516200 [Sesamum alatum]|uniref:Uncharacterized protein n=1 Tax=Sesamum alatum TaxID=300844 RepID=A0AAE1XSR6_9LAMI|nr:hypothetical protein Salat_2516200 [Sesamum alatum]